MVISLWPLVVYVCVCEGIIQHARLIQGNSLSKLLIAPSKREREGEREILSQKLRVQDWIGFMIIKLVSITRFQSKERLYGSYYRIQW